jgi:hydrogenase maturation protease
MTNPPRILLLGYGNLDRQDDGVAWHILARVARSIGRKPSGAVENSPDTPQEFDLTGDNPEFLFVLQLTPELAETVAGFDRVCFVDAHTGNIQKQVRFLQIDSHFQSSPFTHHLTAQSLLSLAETLYGKKPAAYLLSVRGYEFGFSQALSPAAERLALQASNELVHWVESSLVSTGDSI